MGADIRIVYPEGGPARLGSGVAQPSVRIIRNVPVGSRRFRTAF
jgi:hypothetical protein